MYPDLPEYIKTLHEKGIRFLGYINPYLVNDGKLYEEGRKKGVFAKHADGSEYLVDFGKFHCGVVDLTSEEAYNWFKDNVIKKHSLEIGIDGYMADFGEYLPTDDIVLSNGKSPMTEIMPVVQVVSHATRPMGSWARMASSTASEMASQSLSGCPSVTDSDVNRRFAMVYLLLIGS